MTNDQEKQSPPLMPDLSRATRLFRHNLWSATAALLEAGVPLNRVRVEYRGGGWDADTVVDQAPSAGTPLIPGQRVVLGIAGTGALESLPYSLREDSGPGEFLGDRICGIVDAALARTRSYFHEGAGHFRLSPNAAITARRWIDAVMRADATRWNEADWHRVAMFFSALPRFAGRSEAIPAALRFVYGLEVGEVRTTTGRLAIEAGLGTRLGQNSGRLGIDAIAGDGLLVEFGLTVTIGPVTLGQYQQHFAPKQAGRHALYRLLLPTYLPGVVVERWVVAPRDGGYRLGVAGEEAVLGVSSYLSTAA